MGEPAQRQSPLPAQGDLERNPSPVGGGVGVVAQVPHCQFVTLGVITEKCLGMGHRGCVSCPSPAR